MNASPALRAQIGKLSHAFNEDVGDAAAAVGRGEDYAKAMRDYARAAKLSDLFDTVKKHAIPAVAGGGLVAAGLKELLK